MTISSCFGYREKDNIGARIIADLDDNKEYAYTTEDKKTILVIRKLELKTYDDNYYCKLEGYLFF